MKEKFTKLLLLCCLMLAQEVLAQVKTISGKVSDSAGNPLIGVVVKLKIGKVATSTDGSGNYSIKANRTDVIVFSYIGSKNVEELVNNRDVINITLEDLSTQLNEIVVVGYGTQKKVNLTGSITTLDSAFLHNRPITDATQALQGAKGVYVNQSSGQPGADGADIRIRGLGSLGNNSPLILIDGIEGSMRDLNPDDISTISVLKDASSAAIYGNRAANGVVLISTKKGKKNSSSIEYSGYYGVSKAISLPDIANNSEQVIQALITAKANDGITDNVAIDALADLRANPSTIPNTNWFDVMFKNSASQSHNLRVSGGGDKNTYSIALNYLDNQGVLEGSSAKKYSISTNLTSNVTKWLDVSLGLFGTRLSQDQSLLTPYNMMYIIYRALPFQQAFAINPNDGQTYYADQPYKLNGQNVFRNPYSLATEGMHNTTSNRLLTNISATVKLPFNIKYNITGGLNNLNSMEKNFAPLITLYNNKTNTFSSSDYFQGDIKPRSAIRNSLNDYSLTLFQTLNWEHTLNKDHNVKVLGGYSLQDSQSDDFNGYVDGFVGDNLTDISAGSTNPTFNGTTNTAYVSKLKSYFGRVNYDYKSKYLLEASFRYDGSSRFSPDNQWGFFPSASAGWNIGYEDFLKDLKWLSTLKLRASYGSLGNERIGNFLYSNNYDIGGYSFGGVTAAAIYAKNYSDPNITWETTTIGNLGLESEFFKNKLNMEVEFYNKTTDNILQSTILGSIVGDLQGPVKNIGKVRNTGLEVTLGHKNKVGKFNYNISFNGAVNSNKVLELYGGTPLYSGNQITIVGSPINSYYVLHSTGIFQTIDEVNASTVIAGAKTAPGDLKFEDVNRDGKIDNNDRIVTGSSVPKYTYGVNLGGGYGNFDFRIFFQGVKDVTSMPFGILNKPFTGGGGLTNEWLTDAWTTSNTNATLPRLQVGGGVSNGQASTFWLQDASYLRMKNIQVGYKLPANIAGKVGVKNIYLYANAQNLITFTNYKDADPERTITSDRDFDYPAIKTVSFGLNVTF
ncbi:TonB-dependent receptor [Arcticibacter svalbardensis MN12-7]|uniref:TonB-dependent receptor n=1 Tax=Arcticibacter svalbardensis MN12-7 TaxID=1150600 RepID=R9GL40_9SPHI|nr:TonB-dependent receptor [Arcticibacter svalbardensis]EOR92547.1 TonB-dependent receptor [Arcticibacter svalbardensis MN12-7]